MKNKNIRISSLNFLVIVIILSTISTKVGADISVGTIKVTPDKPALLSDVTFSVDISGDSITSVRIIIRECNKEIGLCHAPPQNISMEKVSSDIYEADVTLLHDDVTSITYNVVVKSDGKWTDYDEYTTYLSVSSNSNGNDSIGTPGFEIFVFLIAIISFSLIYKKIRQK